MPSCTKNKVGHVLLGRQKMAKIRNLQKVRTNRRITKDDIDDIQALLASWAMWREMPILGLGYPSTSVEYRIWRDGGVSGTHRATIPSYRPHIRMNRLDAMICALPEKQKITIFVRHLLRMSDHDGSAYLGITVREYTRSIGDGYDTLILAKDFAVR